MKIGDFGLARDINNDSNYVVRGNVCQTSDNHLEMYFIIAELRSVYGIGQNVVVFKGAQPLTYITKN